jgi:hypothetical protein
MVCCARRFDGFKLLVPFVMRLARSLKNIFIGQKTLVKAHSVSGVFI